MSGEQLGEIEADRLDAAVFEQRRLSHMLRRRGQEIEELSADRERLAGKVRKALEREEALRKQARELEVQASSLTADRDRLNTELKQAQYEARRAERHLAKAEAEAGEELQRRRAEIEGLERRLEEAGGEVESLTADGENLKVELTEVKVELTEARAEAEGARYEARRAERRQAKAEESVATVRRRAQDREQEDRKRIDGLAAARDDLRRQLEEARYETRRAQRRLAKADRLAAEAQRQYRLQLDALSAELRAGLESRDEALAAGDRIAAERDEALAARDGVAAERDLALAELPEVERDARELGRAEIETERLLALEREREAALVASDLALGEVGEHLRRVRSSRSWRWGQAVSRALRALSLRRRSTRSALDAAVERLEADGERARGEHPSA